LDEAGYTDEEKEQYYSDNIFHVRTFTVDEKRDFPELPSTGYSDAAVSAAVATVQTDYSKYLYAIDSSPRDRDTFQPKLACAYPCLTCHPALPDFCLSCWGPTIPI
jgi:hypothetical protein